MRSCDWAVRARDGRIRDPSQWGFEPRDEGPPVTPVEPVGPKAWAPGARPRHHTQGKGAEGGGSGAGRRRRNAARRLRSECRRGVPIGTGGAWGNDDGV